MGGDFRILMGIVLAYGCFWHNDQRGRRSFSQDHANDISTI
jgi:hypothetical protein